ncbi:DedA family protein [Hydrogenimonas sp.]
MDTMLHTLAPWISHYGLLVVFFGMMVEGTTMILLTGVFCSLGMLHPPSTLPVAVAGAIVGDHLWYWAGRKVAPGLLARFPSLRRRVEAVEPAVKRRGAFLAFGSRFIYSGAILFPLTLGLQRFDYGRFALYDALGATLWANVGLLLGYTLGIGIERYVGRLERVEHLLWVVLAIAFGVQVYKKVVRKKF